MGFSVIIFGIVKQTEWHVLHSLKKTRLITMRSKPDYVEFVLLQLLLMLLNLPLDLALTLLLPCLILSLTLPWTCPDLVLNWLWHCHDLALTLPWPFPNLASTLHWLCLDLALTLPWPCLDPALTLPWLCLVSVTVGIFLIWTNVTRTNVAWTNINLIVGICSRCSHEAIFKVSS